MEFFDDPNYLDQFIIPIIREYINSGDWDLVLEEIEKYIRVLKSELFKLHTENGTLKFDFLANCESVSDVLHTKDFIHSYGADAFQNCLISLFGMKECLPYGDKDFHRDVDILQQNLKNIMLNTAMPQIWVKKKSLQKGRKQPKALVSLEAFILDCFEKYGVLSTAALKKKIITRKEYNPVIYKHDKTYHLYYDPTNERIYQAELFSDGETVARIRDISLRQIDKYRTRLVHL